MPSITVVFDDADGYERFMGQWSRAVGEKFLGWLDPPKQARWLDVGCGTGAFAQLILDKAAPRAVSGVDPAPAQIEYARKHLPQAEFRVADALALPFDDATFDIVSSALVIHFLPDRHKAFGEMRRVASGEGIVAGYTWNRTADSTFAPYAPMARGLKSIGATYSMSPLVPEAEPEGMKATLTACGFRDIAVETIEVESSYRDFEDYWQAQTPTFAPTGKSVAALPEDRRATLREAMRKMLPAASDGTIRYSARAVAFKARK